MHIFIVFCSIAAMVLLVFAHLCPVKWKPRTGLGWPIDHFLAYFAVTLIVYLAWPRPLVVGAALMGVSALLEGPATFHGRSHAQFSGCILRRGWRAGSGSPC
jgi:hypothetical protein